MKSFIMGFIGFLIGKTNDGKSKMVMIHYDGLPNYPKNAVLDMILDAENRCLIFKIRNTGKANIITLPFSKITNVRTQSTAAPANMLGSVLAGGVLFGTLGAVIAGLAAENKQVIKKLYVITYISNNKKKTILLKQNGNVNFKKFQKELASYLGNAVNTEKIKNVTL